MNKRLIASVASFTLLFTTAFCGLSTPVYASDADSSSLPKVIKDNTTFIRDPETGHIAAAQEKTPEKKSSKSSSIIPNSASVPSAYGNINEIKNTYPGTRNQQPYGTCWAHAAAACAEFDLIKNHNMPKSYADFSELQLAYLHYNTGKELPGLDGDQVYIPSSASKNYLEVGGNIIYSMHTLAQWKCFNYESALPYSTVTNNNYSNPYSSISYWNMDDYHKAAQLRNVRTLNIKSDPAAVKQAIMDYGAAYISYCHEARYYKESDGYGLYYNPYSDITNHDVVIVGWDDNIYGDGWPGRGGWLVRNSWSTDQNASPEYTYFYMSYYDASITTNAHILDFEAYSASDNIYQHDGSTTHATIQVDGAANVFTANSSMAKASEKLDSVMIAFTRAKNVNYKIEVYTRLTSSSPTSGYLNPQATTTGWTNSAGIYTVQLKSPVYLSPGEKYSIVITSLNGSKPFDLETGTAVTYKNASGQTTSWFTTTASADAGESFFQINKTWKDATSYGSGYGNMCIKALTVDDLTKKYNINYVLKGGTNNSNNPVYYLNSQSGSVTLKKPVRKGYHFLGWYSDSSFKNKVTSVNYNTKKNQTLYARWCSDNNKYTQKILSYATMSKNGNYKIVCSACGTVKESGTAYKASSVKLSYAKMAYNGKNRSPVPVIKNSKGQKLKNGTDYTYKYNQSARKKTGRYSVTIKFIGRYTGSKTLWFTVVPKAPSTASAKLHGFNDITVTWAKATGATGYYVYYKKAAAPTYKNYKLTTKRTLKFNNMAGNVKYNFKIIPYYKKGKTFYKSKGWKIVSATTLKKLKQPQISKKSNGQVSLTWDNSKGASGYQVWWSGKKSGKYNKLCDYSNGYVGVSFSVGKNQQYWYKTRAYKTVNKKKIFGPWSDPKAYTLR